jgi:hypothetical protein
MNETTNIVPLRQPDEIDDPLGLVGGPLQGRMLPSRSLQANASEQKFSGMIKQKLHLLFCRQRRRKRETHDDSVGLCVRALQYVRARKNGSP